MNFYIFNNYKITVYSFDNYLIFFVMSLYKVESNFIF